MLTNHEGKYPMKILRVNLSKKQIHEEQIDPDVVRKYVGGTGLGAKFLYEEVPPGIAWSDPANRIMLFTGPLAGTRVAGSGTFSVVSKGPMTNMAGASQANGFFGAFLRFSGFDGIILSGTAENWVHLHIHDGTAELHDAKHLVGKNTWETEDTIRHELNKKCSIYSIGPAGENLVRFAAIVGDHGHVVAHNGLGAVMGSKKLKAISVERGQRAVAVAEPNRLSKVAKELFEEAKKADPNLGKYGTAFAFEIFAPIGALPIRNYTTNIFPEWEKFKGEYLRNHFKIKPIPCWACRMGHCSLMEVTEGPYKGFVGEEPEYEALAAMGSIIGQTDPGSAVMLANLIDRLGMDCNESGYLTGWLMECYEKGLLKKNDLDGIEMTWGNVEATVQMLKKIAHRQGCGNLLAEGVKRAAETIGGEVLNCAVYTQKGASPRGHDHRGFWTELIDTCLSNTGTIETGGPLAKPHVLGLAPVQNRFDPLEVSTQNAQLNGGRQFEDCLGVCRFCTSDFNLTLECLNAITGWDFTIPEAMDVGRRIINQLRVFNFRHGLTKEIEAPSSRYGSTPVDGPAKGIAIMPHWESIRRNYYQQMGWDPETGRPLPETLEKLGLGHLVKDLRG
jgi:aldehyde:ferredoxin oxidoreductase